MYLGELRQSTAATVLLGPFVDETDGYTLETGLAAASISLHKNGGSAATVALGSHLGAGMYSFSVTTSHSDTLGRMTIAANPSGARPMVFTFGVLTKEEWDRKYAGTVNEFGERRTTIDTVTSQTSLILAAGASSVNDAYKGMVARIRDVSNGYFPFFAPVSGYAGATRTVTLEVAPGFTVVAGDEIDFIPVHPYVQDIIRQGVAHTHTDGTSSKSVTISR